MLLPIAQKPKNKRQGLDKKRYNRIAPFYDQFESPMELFNYSRWRAKLRQHFPSEGTILEVGVGTGKNLPFYNKQQRLLAIDISEKMLQIGLNLSQFCENALREATITLKTSKSSSNIKTRFLDKNSFGKEVLVDGTGFEPAASTMPTVESGSNV